MTDVTSTKYAALALLADGFQPVLIGRGTKRPTERGWQNRRYTADEIEDEWPEHSNLGVNLGEPSGGLIDIDCDAPETVQAAKQLLGTASVQSGRGVAEATHYWFRATGEVPTTKLTDPTNGEMLVELRSTGAQTVIPPSVHPDGSPYRWLKPLSAAALDDVDAEHALEIVRTIAAVGLLARYWPKRGSRHLAHMALCGGLLREPGGRGVNPEWRDKTLDFARLVVSLAGDDWWERDANVDTTIAALERGDMVRGWTTLTEYVDPKVVWTVRDWLGLTPPDDDGDDDDLEYDEVDADDGWNRVRLGEAIRHGIPEPEQVIDGLGVLYKGEVHTIQSAGGSGKTLIALWLLLKAMQQGDTVMFIDEENGVNEVARRLISLGADPDMLDERLVYYAMPSVNWSQAVNARRLLQVCEDEDVTLVLFDSVMDMLSSSGFEENDNAGFNTMYEGTGKALKQAGRTVLFLDHVSKQSSFQARGASAKFDQSSVVWGVKVDEKFDADTAGRVTLKRRKGRLSVVEQEIVLTITPDGDGRTVIRHVEPTRFTVPTSDDDRYRAEAERIIRDEGEVLHTDLAKEVVGRKADVLKALREWDLPDGISKVKRGRATWYEVKESDDE